MRRRNFIALLGGAAAAARGARAAAKHALVTRLAAMTYYAAYSCRRM
jgi:hypothetical protein